MAKSRRKAQVTLLGVVRRRRPALLVSTALCATVTMVVSLPAAAQPAANARPTGGVVVGGNVSISQSTNQTTINQSTQRGAIDWQSFNVGSQQSVQFKQPSSSSVTLNEVVGPNPSQIAGRITANGQIIIENQSGVIFYKGSQVNTAGIMVTAATSSNGAVQTFLNGGKLALDQAANPNAIVQNQGQITVKQAGLAALVAPQVVNSGVITAKLGTVVLAGATKAVLDLYGDGMMSLDVTGQVVQAPNGALALVTNSGLILADGGTVRLTALAADGLVQTLVNAGGRIRANSVGSHTGTVTVDAVGGSVTVVGQLDAVGEAPGTTGGAIEVNATGNVTVASGARINASGQAGGGLVAVGTTLQRAKGGPSVTATQTAAGVSIQQGAVIAANATKKGNGGRVTVLSTSSTDMAGTISATGGPQGGNGGFVEISGNQGYALTGAVDVLAPLGAAGTILIDPTYLDIITGVAATGDEDLLLHSDHGTLSAGTTGVPPDTVSNGEIDALGATGNVVLQTSSGTIGVHANIDMVHGLTLEAGTDLLIDRGATIEAGGGLFLSSGTYAGTGSILIGTTTGTLGSGAVLLSAPTVVMYAGSASAADVYGINLTDTIIRNGAGGATTVDLSTTGGGITQSSAVSGTIGIGTISTATLFSGLGVTGTVSLGGINTIAALGSIALTNGNFSLNNTGKLGVSGPLTGGTNISIASGTIGVSGSIGASGTLLLDAGAGGIALNTGHVLSGTVLDLSASGGGVTQVASGTITAGTLQSTSGITGTVTLAGANTIGTLGSIALTDSNFSLSNAGSLSVAGPLTGGTNVALTSGTIAVTGSIGATGTLLLGAGAGGIALNTGHVLNGTVVDLSASGGGVTQVATGGSIVAGTLQSTAGVTGGTSLISATNSIATIGNFNAATGNFALKDTAGLTVAGTLAAPNGNASLSTTGSIAIATGGSVGVITSTGTASFSAASFANAGTVTGNTFEYSQNTPGNLVLGTGGSIVSLAGIDTTNVRLGEVGGSITANAITIASSFGSAATALELDTTGTIAESTGAVLSASTLTGTAGTLGATFTNGGTNLIANLGTFISSGGFTLTNGESIDVTGVVNASNIALDAPTIEVSGRLLTPTTGTLLLDSTVGGIAFANQALVNVGTVDLISATGISEPNAGANSANIAAVLLGATADAGSILLLSPNNHIDTVSGLIANGGGVSLVVGPGVVLTGSISGDNLFFQVAQNGGTLQIGNASTAAVMSATAASNPTVSLIADNITESGTGNSIVATDGSNNGIVEIAPFSAGRGVFLGGTFGANGLVVDHTLLGMINTGSGGLLRIGDYTGGSITAGDITVAGNVNLGTVAATLELDSTQAISEPGSLVLEVSTLTGTGAQGVSLLGSNVVGTLAAFSSGRDFVLVDSVATLDVTGPVQSTATGREIFIETPGSGQALAVLGSIVAPNGTIGLVSDALTLGSGATINAGGLGTVELAPRTIGSTITLSSGSAFAAVTADELRIGAYHDATNGGANVVSAGSIDIAGAVSLAAVSILDLNSGGAISEPGSIAVTVATLSGTAAGDVSLLGTSNAISTLGGFIAGGTFDFADAGATSLLVSGRVQATSATITGAGTTTIESGITATSGTVFVNSGSISLNTGGVLSGPTVDIDSSGGITEANGGSIVAGTLLSSLGSTGNVDLGSANSVGTLANFIVNTGTFHLTNSGTSGLAVDGSVIATGVTLDGVSNTLALNGSAVVAGSTVVLSGGSIALNGSATLGQTGALVDVSTSSGGVIEASTATIVAATLQSSHGVHNGATLLSASNSIAALGTFGLASGDLRLLDTGSIAVSGSVSAADVTITAGTIGVTNSIIAIGGSLGLTATAADVTLGSGTVLDAATVDLSAPAGSVTEINTGTIIAGTLVSGQGVLNGARLLGGGNTIATLGTFVVASGDLRLHDTGSLLVSGSVNAAEVTLTAGAIGVSNSIVSGGSLGLTATATGIALNSGGVVNGPTVDLSAPNGSVTEASGATLVAGTLLSGQGVKNTVSLLTGNNTIGTLGAFSVTNGDLLILDATNLTIAGAVSADDIFAKVGVAGGTLEIGSGTTGAILSAIGSSSPTISLIADNITEGGAASSITAIGGTVAIAPFSANRPVSLDGVPPLVGELVLDNTLLSDLNTGGTGTLRVGGYVDAATGAGTITAGAISVDGVANLTAGQAATLRLDSGGVVYESGTSIIEVGTLVGSVVAGVTLSNANNIRTLGSFTAGGSFDLSDPGTTSLLVTGPVSGVGVSLSGAGLTTITGTIAGSSGSNVMVSAGSIALAGGELVGNTVDLDSSAGGITESAGGSIVAVTLLSSLNSTGNVDLGSANNVGTLGNFIVSGGTFHLDNGTIGNTLGLTVNGSVIASSVTLDHVGGLLLVNGSIGATSGLVSLLGTGAFSSIELNNGRVTGPTITLNTGSVVMAGTALLGQTGALLDVTTTNGGVTEAGSATIIAATLQSAGGIDGSVSLPGTSNAIAAIGSLAVTTGTFDLTDTGDLGVTSTLTAAAITITDGGLLTVSGSLIAGGIVNLAADDITIPGLVSDDGAGTTTLTTIGSSGTIYETGSLIAGTLTGSSGGATTLVGSNAVGTLAGFTAVGFTLDDTVPLQVIDTLNAGPSATILDSGVALTVAGSIISTGAVSLTAGSIAIPGLVTDGGTGTTSLVATAGTIFEAGTLIAGTLTGEASDAGASTSVTLIGATPTSNAIATLGSFTASSFTLDDGRSLAVNGVLGDDVSATIKLPGSATLTIGGAIRPVVLSGTLPAATSVSLTAGNIAIPGTVSDGGAGTTSLAAIGTGGTIYGNGMLIAGTLTGSSNGATTLVPAGSALDQVGTLGNFTALGFTLNDGTPLVVSGTLSAGPHATVFDSGALTVSGSILSTTSTGAGAVSLTASSITIPGLVSDGGSGTTSLVATAGTIWESGTLIAGILTGSASASATLTGATPTANQIAALGNFVADGFTLVDDAPALAVSGTLSAGPDATILENGALTVSGSILSTSIVSLTGNSIAIPGLVTDGGAGTTSLVATAGAIDESGTLIAGTLSGSSTGATDLTGATTITNRIFNLGSFSAASFVLNDGTVLAVAGPVNGGSSASIFDAQALTVNGSLFSTNAISLTGSSIAINGSAYVSDGGTGTSTTSLIATNGTINEIGTLIAGTLSGSSTGVANLIGAGATINQVGTLASFSAAGFTLNDGAALTVAGPVNGGTSATILDAGALTVNGSLFSSNAISLTGSSASGTGNGITINGSAYVSDGGSGTTSLTATSGGINEIGTLIAGTLSGSAISSVSLTGATATTNKIANIGRLVSEDDNVILNDGENLTVIGGVYAGNSVVITDTGGVTNNGTIGFLSNSAISVTGSITNNGEIGGGLGNLQLVASTDITNNGTMSLSEGTGILSATGNISNNGMLAFAGNATLVAGGSINDTSNGTITAGGFGGVGPTVLLVAQTGTINEASGGAISATNAGVDDIQLTASAGNITVAGAITAAVSAGGIGYGTVDLTAGGSITQSGGSIVAGGPGTTVGGTLVPSISLVAQTGTIGQSAGAVISATDAGAVVRISAASNIGFAGTISAPGTTSAVMLVSGAAITETPSTGFLQGATLTGSAGTGASLTATSGSGNLIATLGSFTTGSSGPGDFILLDGESLTVIAPVVADNGSVAITATHFGTLAPSSLSNMSTIQASGGVTLLSDTDLTNTGSVVALGGDAALTATAGTLTNSGVVLASGNATLLAGTDLTNSNTGSVIAQGGTAALTASGGTLSNAGQILASTGVTLLGQTDLTNTGSVIAEGSSAIITAATGSLTNNGLVQAATSTTLTAGAGILNAGSVIAQGGDATLTASGGTLFNSGTVSAFGSAILLALDDLTTNGAVIAQTGSASLTSTAGALTNGGLVQAYSDVVLFGDTNLTNTGSVISVTSYASLTAETGTLSTSDLVLAATDVTLNGDTGLTNTGSVIAQTGSAWLTSAAGALTNGGLVQAYSDVVLFGDTNLTNTGSVISMTSYASLTAETGTLSTSNLVLAATDVTLTGGTGLSNSGSVIAQTGSATLTAVSGELGNSGLISATAINAAVSLFANDGSIVQSGGSSSIIAGGSLVMDASGGITLAGLVKGTIEVALDAGGAIVQTGTLIGDLLTGSAGAGASFAGATPTANQVATLGTFTAGGTFALNDGINLLLDGIVKAPTILIDDGKSTISLGNGGFETSGVNRPAGALQINQLPTDGSDPGAYLQAGNVIETGANFTVTNPFNAQESILSITLPTNAGGTLSFGAFPGGLVAANTWLLLSVSNGSATGGINVKALDLSYSPPPGRALFSGMVDGDSGAAAAGVAFIQPQPNANFRIDGCPIHSVNCALLPLQGVPASSPVGDINVGAPLNQTNPEDLILPVVSDERYELVPCDDPNAEQGCPAVTKPPPHH